MGCARLKTYEPQGPIRLSMWTAKRRNLRRSEKRKELRRSERDLRREESRDYSAAGRLDFLLLVSAFIHRRACLEYRQGVEQFLEFAYSQQSSSDNKIKCPCVKCNNGRRKTQEEMGENIEVSGSEKNDDDDMIGLLVDTHGMMFDEDLQGDNYMESQPENANDEA
ncbi:hypothetical protein QQ045_019354 [Rhodiola kirilowii]